MKSNKSVLLEKTNKPYKMKKACEVAKDDVIVLEYLEKMKNTTEDYNLRYDLTKCIKIIKGEENQEEIEFVNELEKLFTENEQLREEKNELIMKVESLKEEIESLKNL
ncbi:hypothetical protein BDAP_000671 [Binucleata daphniae]